MRLSSAVYLAAFCSMRLLDRSTSTRDRSTGLTLQPSDLSAEGRCTSAATDEGYRVTLVRGAAS
jgi:hypothetical protein